MSIASSSPTSLNDFAEIWHKILLGSLLGKVTVNKVFLDAFDALPATFAFHF